MSEQTREQEGPKPPFAFPLSAEGWFQRGMTLRDYFAAQAVGGLLAFSPMEVAGQYDPEVAARMAYKVADAMLVERKNQGAI